MDVKWIHLILSAHQSRQKITFKKKTVPSNKNIHNQLKTLFPEEAMKCAPWRLLSITVRTAV